MELLETQDPEKKRLIETSDRHRREMEREVTAISEKTERIIKNALIVGGALALTYFFVSQISKSKKKKAKARSEEPMDKGSTTSPAHEPDEPSLLSQIGSKVINHATLILLDVAREKLSEYLQTKKKPDENP